MSKYLLQSFELPQPSGDHYVATTTIDPPTGFELHSWKTVSLPDESGRWGLAEMLWEKSDEPERQLELDGTNRLESRGLGDVSFDRNGVRFGKPGNYWGSLPPSQVRALALEILNLWRGRPGEDVAVFWRGSVSDLATDLSEKLTAPQLQELAGEVAIKWRERAGDKR